MRQEHGAMQQTHGSNACCHQSPGLVCIGGNAVTKENSDGF